VQEVPLERGYQEDERRKERRAYEPGKREPPGRHARRLYAGVGSGHKSRPQGLPRIAGLGTSGTSPRQVPLSRPRLSGRELGKRTLQVVSAEQAKGHRFPGRVKLHDDTGFARPHLTDQNEAMASYSLNEQAVAQARRLIDAHQYVLDSVWSDVQPSADDENAFLESHSWDDYAAWHLGLTDGASDNTKARYAFVYGDLRRVHRMGLIACQYRAAEWQHKKVELAAHELLQHLDNTRA
jgi:hypothetical protein